MIKEIAETPALREEAGRTLVVVESMAATPRNPNDVWVAIQKLTLVRRMPDFGGGPAASPEAREQAKAMRGAWLKLYYDVLKDYPLLAVHQGVEDFLKTNTTGHFPQPAELRKFAEPHGAKLFTAVYRLREAMKLSLDVDKRSPEERAKVIAMMKEDGIMDEDGKVDFARWMRRKGAPKPKGPQGSKAEMAEKMRAYAAQREQEGGEDYA